MGLAAWLSTRPVLINVEETGLHLTKIILGLALLVFSQGCRPFAHGAQHSQRKIKAKYGNWDAFVK